MPTLAVVGGQFRDEAKGKVIDYLATFPDIVGGIRYAGGNNAGHTVVLDREYKLHLIPSTVFNGKPSLIGHGVVIDPGVLNTELSEELKLHSIDTSMVRISKNAHLIMPYHILEDRLLEARKGGNKVGTTGRGIGPCYADKAYRLGIQMTDLLNPDELLRKISFLIPLKQEWLKVLGYDGSLNAKLILEEYLRLGENLRPYIANVLPETLDLANRGVLILEGAQGTGLDIDLGNYPHTTSSHSTVGGALEGTGISRVDKLLLVGKPYTTRVGEGPLPTEEKGEAGDYIVKKGLEFGTTTGRQRRVGWFDLPLIRYAIAVNGANSLAITKLDVLGGMKKVKLTTKYRLDGSTVEKIYDLTELDRCSPVYEEMDGWNDLSEEEWLKIARSGEDALPPEAKHYVNALEDLAGVPISILSVGRTREATIFRESARELFSV